VFGGRYGHSRGCLWWLLPGTTWWPFWYGWGDDTSIGDSWTYGSGWGPKKKEKPKILARKAFKADPYFKDEKLEQFMAAGKFRDARVYLQDMLKISKEMGNKQAELNFATYDSKIELAELKAKRLVRQEENAWKPKSKPAKFAEPVVKTPVEKPLPTDDGVSMEFLD
jgi:hypothetical protein